MFGCGFGHRKPLNCCQAPESCIRIFHTCPVLLYSFPKQWGNHTKHWSGHKWTRLKSFIPAFLECNSLVMEHRHRPGNRDGDEEKEWRVNGGTIQLQEGILGRDKWRVNRGTIQLQEGILGRDTAGCLPDGKETGILQGFRLCVAGAAPLSAQAVMMPWRHVV